MAYRAVTHIALVVSPLRQAEAFYQALFALDVAFREAETADGWWTLSSHASWDDALAAGIHLGLCSLHRDAFTLASEVEWVRTHAVLDVETLQRRLGDPRRFRLGQQRMQGTARL